MELIASQKKLLEKLVSASTTEFLWMIYPNLTSKIVNVVHIIHRSDLNIAFICNCRSVEILKVYENELSDWSIMIIVCAALSKTWQNFSSKLFDLQHRNDIQLLISETPSEKKNNFKSFDAE